MQPSKKITRIFSWMALVVIGLGIIGVPAGYFALSYQYMEGALETEAEINARIITGIINANPNMWEYEQVRIAEYLARRPRRRYPEVRRVFNAKNELVAENVDLLESPLMSRSVGLFDAGVVTGRIEISRSLRPLMRETALLALLMLPLGAGAYIILDLLPIRTIRGIEETLRRERDTAQKYLDVAGVMLVALDKEHRVTMINRRGRELLEYREEDILGKDWFDHFVSGNNRNLPEDIERPVMTKSGRERMIAWHHIVLTDANGSFAGTLSSGEDITERRQSEEKIRFLASIMQNLPEGVCAIDLNGQVMSWNRGAEKMLGYKAEEIVGRPIATIIPGRIAKQELDHCLTLLNTEGIFTGYESVRLTRDRKQIPVELTGVAIKDSAGAILNYASVMVDISDRKRAEEERLRGRTLESIGMLAGGIAHDYNNLLTAIVTDIHLAKMAVPPGNSAHDRLSDAAQICEMAAELSKRLITFSAGGEPVKKTASLSDLVSGVAETTLANTNISLQIDLPEELYRVSIDEDQIRQVIQHVATNAREAMPHGGTLSIRGMNLTVSERDNLPMREGRYLKLSIRDTGIGIPRENLARIFDPYFTTKDTYSRKGLGLGLTVCYSVVKRHNGLMTVESEVNKGTTVSLYFPAAS